MDKIYLNNLAFYAYHGALPEESKLGQKFFVDLELGLDLSKAGKSDALEDTLCYATAYDLVQSIVTGERFKLLEALAETICQQLFLKFECLQEIKLCIRKPEAPIPGVFDFVGVELHRQR